MLRSKSLLLLHKVFMSPVTKSKESVTPAHNWATVAIAEAKKRQNALGALSKVIAEAEGVFTKVFFPNPRMEAWKYTNTDAIAKGAFELASESAGTVAAESLASVMIAGLNGYTVVFVDGVFAPEHSSKDAPKGIRIARFADGAVEGAGSLAPHADEAFAALATALLTDGVSIVAERNAVASKPIHIIHVATPHSSGRVVTPRLAVRAEDNSHVTIIESHVTLGGEGYLSLPVAEVSAADGATVDYYKYQHEAVSATHVSNTIVDQGRSGVVSTHIFSFGGALVRNNVTVNLKGSGANAVLNGLSLLSGSQHVDNSTEIHHIEPTIESREHFKGIYSDSSRGVFSGTITVDKIAQKTNAFQSNQALLLSPNASIETRPQLKIWADDVKCTHGATVGQLDQEAMFYLRSRGISREEARNFLIHAFASEVLTTVKVLPLKEYVEAAITEKLGK
jgi:Fe-S cluster assembly protein SufD